MTKVDKLCQVYKTLRVQYPINLNLNGVAVLVVGGGRVALRKIEGLLACGADVTVIAPSVLPEIESSPLKIHYRKYATGDILSFLLIITATGIESVDQQIFNEAQTAKIWINSADDPERCTFTLPAIVRRGDLMITVSTGGVTPALSSWLRDRIGQEIGAEYAQIVTELAQVRADYQAHGISTEDVDWKPIIENAIGIVHTQKMAE